jgi:hypothetical protein
MKLPTIKKPVSAKTGSFDINNKQDLILRLARLKNNSILFCNLGYIPKEWLVSIAVIIAGVRS